MVRVEQAITPLLSARRVLPGRAEMGRASTSNFRVMPDVRAAVLGAVRRLKAMAARLTNLVGQSRTGVGWPQGEERYQTLVEAMSDAVNLKDRDGRYLMANSEQARRLGRMKEDIVGKTPWDLYDRFTAQRIMEQHFKVIRSGVPLETEEQLPGQGEPAAYHIQRIPVKDSAGHVAAVMTVSRDITDMAHARDVLRCQALEDELTGLYNRRGFMALAEHQLRLSDRMGTQVCLVFIDMDNLKVVNDSLGHGQGDDAVVAVARVLKENCRESDVVARLGGDEFAVLAIDTPFDKAASLIQRVRDAFLAVAGEAWPSHPLSLSIGLAHRDPGRSVAIGEMLNQADRLMYEEKMKKRLLDGQAFSTRRFPGRIDAGSFRRTG